MSDFDERPGDPLDNLLAGCTCAQPSAELDGRIAALLRPRGVRWRAFLVPVASFAAGLGVACFVFPLLSQRATPVPSPLPVVVAASAPGPQAPLVVVAEPRQFAEELAGTLNGMPVRVRRIHTQMRIWPSASPASAAANVTLADVVTVDRVAHY